MKRRAREPALEGERRRARALAAVLRHEALQQTAQRLEPAEAGELGCRVAALVGGASPLRRPGDALVGVPDAGQSSALVVRTRSSSVQPSLVRCYPRLKSRALFAAVRQCLGNACLQDWTANICSSLPHLPLLACRQVIFHASL